MVSGNSSASGPAAQRTDSDLACRARQRLPVGIRSNLAPDRILDEVWKVWPESRLLRSEACGLPAPAD